MGRRKSSQKKVSTKAKKVVSKIFKCPFCAHNKAVQCVMNKKDKIATLKCRICSEEYQGRIHYLSEPIDVYNEWINELNEERDSGSEDSDSD
eukprot:g2343.t1